MKFVCFILLVLQFTACSPGKPDIERRTQFLMGTLVEISVRDADKKKAQEAITLAFREIARIEKMMSYVLPDSEVSRVNHAAGTEFLPVSPEVLEVLREGIHWGTLSHGALDITIGPLSQLWNFDEDLRKIPDAEVLRQTASLVNFRDIQIEGEKIRLARPGMALNLSSVAKGFAVDRAIAVLKAQNIRDAIVNAGGDLMAIGTRDGKLPWKIGLQHPREPQQVLASFGVSEKAVATSGDYQRYFIENGIRYHHLLDPATGMPVHGVSSATVIASSTMRANALAATSFLLGADKGMQLINSIQGMEGMIVEENGERRFSKGFQTQPEFKLQ